jgi:hypothetical protein
MLTLESHAREALISKVSGRRAFIQAGHSFKAHSGLENDEIVQLSALQSACVIFYPHLAQARGGRGGQCHTAYTLLARC